MSRHVERLLSAYLDRELAPDEERIVRDHLDTCARCLAELDRLRETRRLLASVPERPLPTAFWAEIRERLLQEEPRPAVVERLRPLWARPVAAVALAAAVLLLVLLPLITGQLDRLRAAEYGVDLFVREHAITAASDPLVDRAYLGLLVTDANLALVGERGREGRR